MLWGSGGISTASAALFSVEFELLHETLGPQAAVEVLRALGEYANRRFKPMGGFSARHRRDQILTIFPHTSPDKARRLVADFARELNQEALARIQTIAQAKMGAEATPEIHVLAGITEVSSTDEIEQIIEKAQAKQQIVAAHEGDSGGSA
jgi:GGDEF domain-containing protein